MSAQTIRAELHKMLRYLAPFALGGELKLVVELINGLLQPGGLVERAERAEQLLANPLPKFPDLNAVKASWPYKAVCAELEATQRLLQKARDDMRLVGAHAPDVFIWEGDEVPPTDLSLGCPVVMSAETFYEMHSASKANENLLLEYHELEKQFHALKQKLKELVK